VVSMLPSGTQDRGFKPGLIRRIFSDVKILRTLLDYVEVGSLRPNYSDISRSKFPRSLTGGSGDRVCSGLSVQVPLHSSSMGALWS
jgi:hypothetical protein